METARTGLRLAEGGGLSYPVNAPSDRTSRPAELLVGGPQLAAEGLRQSQVMGVVHRALPEQACKLQGPAVKMRRLMQLETG